MELTPLSDGDRQENITRPLVLAVDDNEDNLVLLSQVLESLECFVISAKDGKTAILMAQNYQPDLILLDIMLPDLDGIEAIRQLKQNPETEKIPIVAITAMARTEDRDRILNAGCDDYVKKPYIIDELEVTIRRYLFRTQEDLRN